MTERTGQQAERQGFEPLSSSATSRREFLIASGGTLAGMSLLGLVACGGSDSGSSGELVLSVGANEGEIGQKLIGRFNNQHPDLPSATLRVMPADTTQYLDKVRTQFQAGDTDIDVIEGDVVWPAQFAEPGWISSLSDRFSEQERQQFLPGTITAMTYNDQIYGVPWFTDSGLLYYRQDLLEDAGYSEPPTTWDELKEMASKVRTDAGIENGLVFTGAVYEGGTVLGTEFIRNAGGDILDGDTVVIGSPEAVEGLAAQQALVAEGIAPEAVANFKEDEATGAFARGDVVFMRMWPYYYTVLKDPEQSKVRQSQVGLSQVPVVTPGVKGTNVGGGWNFYLSASSADADAAWALIEFLTADEQQKELAIANSVLPTRKAVYDDTDVINKLPAVKLGSEAILSTTTPPVSPYYADMSLAMAEQFNANILGDVTPEEAAASLQDELQSIIERGG